MTSIFFAFWSGVRTPALEVEPDGADEPDDRPKNDMSACANWRKREAYPRVSFAQLARLTHRQQRRQQLRHTHARPWPTPVCLSPQPQPSPALRRHNCISGRPDDFSWRTESALDGRRRRGHLIPCYTVRRYNCSCSVYPQARPCARQGFDT